MYVFSFLFAYSDISDECKGQADFEELDNVHTFVMIVFVVNIWCCISLFCGDMAAGGDSG